MPLDRATMNQIIQFATRAKRRMIAGKDTHARQTCPECGGTVHFAIAGPRNHLQMACETPDCFMRMME